MTEFIRRLVSGNKARFKDAHLNIELDLVYVTDRIIIMGFPAAGVEGFYRNRREDAKKFLEHRHGKNFWIFNFCPLRENSYSADLFDGRVSRYPFPDHHAPPLAILPLVAREIREWLSGSPERVAVLHCKAGKGRSGTLACAYLLSLDDTPSPPMLQRNLSPKQLAEARADEVMATVETEEMPANLSEDEGRHLTNEPSAATPPAITEREDKPDADMRSEGVVDETSSQIFDQPTTETPPSLSPPDTARSSNEHLSSASSSRTNTLEHVLALHTSRRMKAPPSSSKKKVKQGVSIPSQRRWLHYWSLILAHQAPPAFWSATRTTTRPQVCLRHIKVRMRELKGVKMNLVKLASNIIEHTNATKYSSQYHGEGQIWISLARYDDEFVELLEKWERHTRDVSGSMGKRTPGTDHMEEEALSQLFTDGKWDRSKMIRSFARLGDVDGSVDKDDAVKNHHIITHTLRPLSERKWKTIEKRIKDDAQVEVGKSNSVEPGKAVLSTASSMVDLGQVVERDNDSGIVLDAEREVRAKLYIGQVFMGWLWFIPAFHMPQPPPTSAYKRPPTTHLVLARKEIDFALGAGAAIVDVEIALDWIPSSEPSKMPPSTQTSVDSREGIGGEPAVGGIIAGLQAATMGGGVGEALEVTEANKQ